VRRFVRVAGVGLRLPRNTHRRQPDDLIGILDSQPWEGTKKPLVVTTTSVVDLSTVPKPRTAGQPCL
jgi:hypothetical protein